MKRSLVLKVFALSLVLVACNRNDDLEAPEGETPSKSEAAAKAGEAAEQARKLAGAAGAEAAAKAAEAATAARAAEQAAAAAQAAVADLELAPIDLTAEGFSATMQAPKGATFQDSFGTLEVKLGDGKDFFVQVDTEAPDMSKVKASVTENDVQKLKQFHTDSAEVLIYETEAFGRTSFWLDAAVKVGDKTVHCYSGRGAPSFTKAHVERFLTACKSLTPKS